MTDQTDDPDARLLLDVVSTLAVNARRVGLAAIAEAEAKQDDDLIGRVSEALLLETEAIVAGCDPTNRPLISAVEAAGRAIVAVAVQALRTGTQPPAESLTRALELFSSYIAGPGRSRILSAS